VPKLKKLEGRKSMNVKNRLSKIEREIAESPAGRSPDCTCFPLELDPITFDHPEHLRRALSVLCPEHGPRFHPDRALVTYRARWAMESDWESQWQHLPEQHRKAMRATFESRDQYILPTP